MKKIFSLILIYAALIWIGCGDEKAPENTPLNGTDTLKTTVETAYKLDTLVMAAGSGKRTALYAYSFADSSISEVWSKRRESVITFYYSPDEKNAFFITARKQGIRGAFPFIDKVRIYLFDTKKLEAQKILDLDDGLQITSNWQTDSTFEIVFHYYDLFDANFIDQRILLFNNAGKILSDKKRTYELAVDGFPDFPERKTVTSSSDGRFALNVDGNEVKTYRLTDRENEEEVILLETTQKLRNLEWLPGDSLLLFSTLDLSPGNASLNSDNPETSTLLLYNALRHEKKAIYKGSGYKNFLFNGGRVIFDTGFDDESEILYFDISMPDSTGIINKPGGCALRLLPEKPEYNQQ